MPQTSSNQRNHWFRYHSEYSNGNLYSLNRSTPFEQGGFDPLGKWNQVIARWGMTNVQLAENDEKPKNPSTKKQAESQVGSIFFLFVPSIRWLETLTPPRFSEEMNAAYCVDMRAFGIKVGSPSSSCLREVLQDRQRMLRAREHGEQAFYEELLGVVNVALLVVKIMILLM